MMLCLDREQRIIYILGEIFGVTDVVGAEFFEISRENFRQKLARARRALDEACAEIHRTHPFHRSPDFAAALRSLLDRPESKSIVEME